MDTGHLGIAILRPLICGTSLTLTPLRGTATTQKMSTKPSKDLETFPNPNPGRDFHVTLSCPEFTCLCPMTGQPDFATIEVDYVPDQRCVELKSFKLYLWSYRNEGAFHEAVTNQILDDLVAALQPRYAEVTGDFMVRGGIRTVVTATHEQPES